MAPEAARRDIVVVGASAGGLEALRTLVSALPEDYAGTLFIVLHVAPDSPSVLHRLLDFVSPLPVMQAENGRAFRPREIWVARPGLHLVLDATRMYLSPGPRENRHRPSIDVLFRSAAVLLGPRVTGVVLSGMLDDGAAGLWSIQQRGGLAIVQDPQDAMYPGMPESALELVQPDFCMPVRDIADRLAEIARQPAPTSTTGESPQLQREVEMATRTTATIEQLDALGTRSNLTCPECGGAMWDVPDPSPRFRCHVGHAYSMHTLLAAQSERVEAALWAGLRSLEESEVIARRLSDSASRRGNPHGAELFREQATEAQNHAEALRDLLRKLPLHEERASEDS